MPWIRCRAGSSHQERAMRPPGLMVRTHSATAASGPRKMSEAEATDDRIKATICEWEMFDFGFTKIDACMEPQRQFDHPWPINRRPQLAPRGLQRRLRAHQARSPRPGDAPPDAGTPRRGEAQWP